MPAMAGHECPYCRNRIYDEEALLCHFCGNSLHRTSKGMLGHMRDSHKKTLLYITVLLIILGFFFLIVF